jgi:hypothetical protein
MIDAPKMRSSMYVVGRSITPNPVFERTHCVAFVDYRRGIDDSE